MLNPNQLEGNLFSNPLEKMEDYQRDAAKKTAKLFDQVPESAEGPYWGNLPPNVAGAEIEKYGPDGKLTKKTFYNPNLIFASYFDPQVLIRVPQHEGIHEEQPGKYLLSRLYYDRREGSIKLGYIEDKEDPEIYPVGTAITEGAVSLISEKIGGVEQDTYPISSKMVKEMDKKLSEIDEKYSIIDIHKLAGEIEKKLIEKDFSKFISDPSKFNLSEVPPELYELLYIFNRPGIIKIVRDYVPKKDLFYIV
jgi:hypothetical protein